MLGGLPMRPNFVSTCLTLALVVSTSSVHAERVLRYDDDAPIPAGHHVAKRTRYGLIWTGAAFVAVGAGHAAYGATLEPSRASGPSLPASTIFYVIGGLFGAIGAPMLVVGLTVPKTVLVRDDVALTPVVTPSFAGLGLSGSF